jgi:hypothetical protein
MNRILPHPNQLKRFSDLLHSEKPLDNFIGAFCSLDLSWINYFVDEVVDCNGYSRHVFYSHYTAMVDFFHKMGDDYLLYHRAYCNRELCEHYGSDTIFFSGNFSGTNLALHVTVKDDRLHSFYQCVVAKTPVAMKPKSLIYFLDNFPF